MSQSCSLFFYEGYVDRAPTIVNLAKSLNESGYLVTVYATQDVWASKGEQVSDPEKIGDKTNIIYFRRASDIPLVEAMLKVRLGSLVRVIELLYYAWQFFAYIGENNKFKDLKNDVINIGVDKNGSILALIKSYWHRQKFIYLSLELIHPKTLGKLTWITGIVNNLERLAYRNAEAVVIQDEDRFKTLCEYNQYQHPKVFYLPNSPSSSKSLPSSPPDQNYFRELFNLSEEQLPYIILQAGQISDEVCAKSLAKTFNSINDKYALVFHSSEKRKSDDTYIKSLREVNSKNLLLSLEPVPYEQINRVFASATIGLAFYRGIDSNYAQISMASGKLPEYLKQGKPVLVNNIESLVKLNEKYQFGVVVNDISNPSEMEAAIETILRNYTSYSDNAITCFEKEFDFAKKIEPVLSFMAAL